MINTTKQILRKLIDDVEKYQAKIEATSFKCTSDDTKYNVCSYCIEWVQGTLKYYFYYNLEKNTVVFQTSINQRMVGNSIKFEISEDDKYEILNLCQKLKRACEEYTRSKFIEFADVEINEFNEID